MFIWLRFLAIMVALVLTSALPAGAITYGEQDGNAHPYVGLVGFYDKTGVFLWRCSGTLISGTVFLTAGHCTSGTAKARVWFDPEVTGDPYSGGTMGTPYTHPNYDDFATFPNTSDVGVVVLDELVEIDEYGELPERGILDRLTTKRGRESRLFDVVGYGYQSVKPVFMAELVRYKATSMLINLRSALTDGWNIQLSNNPGKGQGTGGTCFGDSGGPVLFSGTNVIVGITSFGANDNCKGVDFGYRIDTEHAQSFINLFSSIINP